MDTFGKYLMRFAQAVDIVSQPVLSEVLDLIKLYLNERLEIQFCELLIPIRVGNAAALRSEWHPGGTEWAQTIKNHEGEYNGQISYAYDLETTMWIVAHSGECLAVTDQYLDLLGSRHATKIPQYVKLTSHPIKTSIIYVLRHDDQILGVLNLESTQHLRATNTLMEELKHIVEALTILYGLHRANTIQSLNTGRALQSLRDVKNLPLTVLPKVFVASSARADKSVTARITRVLAQYDIEVQYWKSDVRPGNILEHLWRSISSSVIGICYFSEPSEAHEYKYQDNQNVVFEAGMMHSLSSSANNLMIGWIPVREANSPEVPFDFGSQQILWVPRDGGDRVDEEALAVELERLLDSASIDRRKMQ